MCIKVPSYITVFGFIIIIIIILLDNTGDLFTFDF